MSTIATIAFVIANGYQIVNTTLFDLQANILRTLISHMSDLTWSRFCTISVNQLNRASCVHWRTAGPSLMKLMSRPCINTCQRVCTSVRETQTMWRYYIIWPTKASPRVIHPFTFVGIFMTVFILLRWLHSYAKRFKWMTNTGHNLKHVHKQRVSYARYTIGVGHAASQTHVMDLWVGVWPTWIHTYSSLTFGATCTECNSTCVRKCRAFTRYYNENELIARKSLG